MRQRHRHALDPHCPARARLAGLVLMLKSNASRAGPGGRATPRRPGCPPPARRTGRRAAPPKFSRSRPACWPRPNSALVPADRRPPRVTSHLDARHRSGGSRIPTSVSEDRWAGRVLLGAVIAIELSTRRHQRDAQPVERALLQRAAGSQLGRVRRASCCSSARSRPPSSCSRSTSSTSINGCRSAGGAG